MTEKDKEFLEKLKQLLESNDLSVELKAGRPSYMVLRGTYGQKIHRIFGISRQGVRWRFWHLFNEIYVEAFSVILAIEKTFGTQLRENAIRISKERYALRQEAMRAEFQSGDVFAHRVAGASDGKSKPTRGDDAP